MFLHVYPYVPVQCTYCISPIFRIFYYISTYATIGIPELSESSPSSKSPLLFCILDPAFDCFISHAHSLATPPPPTSWRDKCTNCILCQTCFMLHKNACMCAIAYEDQTGSTFGPSLWGLYALLLLCNVRPLHPLFWTSYSCISFEQNNVNVSKGTVARKQCCGSRSGIRCSFDPWVRDRKKDPG